MVYHNLNDILYKPPKTLILRWISRKNGLILCKITSIIMVHQIHNKDRQDILLSDRHGTGLGRKEKKWKEHLRNLLRIYTG